MTRVARRAALIRNRVKSFLLYASLSIVIALAFLKISSIVKNEWGHAAYIKWGGLSLFTLGLFTFFIAESEKFLKEWRFWGATAILLAVHLAAFVILLTHIEEWKLTWFMVMVIEYPVFLFLRNSFLTSRPK